MPLQIPDMTIASKAQNPDAFKTIGSMLNVQANQLALQKARDTYNADVSQRQSESSSAGSAATVNAANVQPLIQQQAAQTDMAQTGSQSARFKLTSDQTGLWNQVAQGLVSDPDVASGNLDKIMPLLNSAQQRAIDLGVPAEKADILMAHLKTSAVGNPGGFSQMLKNGILQSQQASQQSATVQPSGPAVSNGQQSAVINTNQFSPLPTGQAIPGTMQQQQLPPVATTFNPATNAQEYVGAQPPQSQWVGPEPVGKFAGDPRQIMQGIQQIKDPQERSAALRALQNQMGGAFPSSAAPVQSGPKLGAELNASGTSATVNKDWEGAVSDAGTAAKDIGVLQNIKQYAPGAATGVTGAREALISGLAGRLGMTNAELTKTNTDLLAKNSAMLALAGGDTNLAKTLAESANPNTHMTPEAITHAADQVIAQRQMAVNKQNLLMPYKGNPDAYNAVLSHFNAISDPRGLQYNSMTPAEKSAMKTAMSPAEREAFGKTLDAQHAAGWR